MKLDDISKPPPRGNSFDEIESIGEASETGSETNSENESTELDDIINALCASTNSYNKTEKSWYKIWKQFIRDTAVKTIFKLLKKTLQNTQESGCFSQNSSVDFDSFGT